MTAENFAWAVLGFLAGFFVLGLIVLRAALMAEADDADLYRGNVKAPPPLPPDSPRPPGPSK